ncbi:uncharacterized protein [Periplaneta americana]|uniref:uncharacterized protein isoform X4 n=1 Tax=Periplaneta americana TaxID=6978 RepID=UPI0037E74231
MNKRQGTSLNFGIKKFRTEGVCDSTTSGASTSSSQSDVQDKQEEHTSTQKKRSEVTHGVQCERLSRDEQHQLHLLLLHNAQCHHNPGVAGVALKAIIIGLILSLFGEALLLGSFLYGIHTLSPVTSGTSSTATT